MDLQRLRIDREAQELRRFPVTTRVIGWRCFTLLLVASILTGAPATIAAQTSQEYAVKAEWLSRFAKFVEWPTEALPDSSSTIHICVLGKDPFGPTLDSTIGSLTAKGRKLTIRRVTQPEGEPSCNVLFISSSERKRMREVVTSLGTSSVLTVGDMDSFAESGGMINLVTERNRVRFEINVDAAEHARLKIDSRLLNLARVIRSATIS
jgi:hypothetical protein